MRKSKKYFILLVITLFLLNPIFMFSDENKLPLYLDSKLAVESRIEDLIKRMKLEEKIGQMSQIHTLSINKDLIKAVRKGEVGSILASRKEFLTVMDRNEIQRVAVEESRLGIPIIFGHDVIHGFRTIFPICLAQSCTWSPQLVKQGARIAAIKASAGGVDWTFAPMIDVSRDPRWGRIAECFGEDTYLNSVFAEAEVSGFQGDDLSDPSTIAACLKHYVAYGAAMGGRDYQYTEISERTLREVYLPPYKAGIDAGALSIMSAFNDISGIPASANPLTLKKILREEWGFDGIVLSDWDAIEELISHGFAADSYEAARKAVTAGVDMEMTSSTYKSLIEQVQDGKVPEQVINEAVRRILRMKFKLGLFEHPYTDPELRKTEYLKNNHIDLARKMARESMVLLKNENGVLPIKENIKSIAVVGPYVNSYDQLGWWSSLGQQKDVVTVTCGIRNRAKDKFQITDKIDEKTDLVILCVGEESRLFGENNCRSTLKLPHSQESLVDSIIRKGKPVILVVFNGRPLDLTGVESKVKAILIAWHPGIEGGNALADILFGDYNPSGKLTTSFPRSVGQIPVYYNHRRSGRPLNNKYIDESAEPLYPFGYGLSYTTFEYCDLKLSSDKIKQNQSLVVSATIQNTGP